MENEHTNHANSLFHTAKPSAAACVALSLLL